MTFYQTLFAIDFASVLFILISLIFLAKNRNFETSAMESSVNAIIFGVFFLLLTMAINALIFAEKGYPSTFASIKNFGTYVTYFMRINDLVLIPLFAICFLVGMYLAKEKTT